MLKAGLAAPSAGNQQPWHFILLTDKELIKEIPKIHPYSAMLNEASAAIVVCGDLEKEYHKGYWVQDCSAATMNILIRAAEKDIGSVWLGVYPREDRVEGIKKLLNIPDNVIPLCVISLGYPAEEKPVKDKFDFSKVHYNKF